MQLTWIDIIFLPIMSHKYEHEVTKYINSFESINLLQIADATFTIIIFKFIIQFTSTLWIALEM